MEPADLTTDGQLLDVGGGTGRIAMTLCDLAKQIILTDPSFEMLRFAAFKPGRQATTAPTYAVNK